MELERTKAAGDDLRSPTRRQALKTMGRTVGSLALGGLALPAGGCSPIVDPETISRVPLADVPEGRRVIMHADRRVMLVREGDSIRAHLMICTHEFCDLAWLERENNYHCGCHAAKFFPDGSPKAGPVEKAMFELPVRVDGDTLIIGPAGELELSGG